MICCRVVDKPRRALQIIFSTDGFMHPNTMKHEKKVSHFSAYKLQALHYSIGTCSKQMLVILNIIQFFFRLQTCYYIYHAGYNQASIYPSLPTKATFNFPDSSTYFYPFPITQYTVDYAGTVGSCPNYIVISHSETVNCLQSDVNTARQLL